MYIGNGIQHLSYIDFDAIPDPVLVTLVDDAVNIVNLPSQVAVGANRTDIAYVRSTYNTACIY